ncbi:24557_t:CDS:10 [Gigaspora margarita]|uniref:24557_t:CDS:1 n=1 Tax=Gigaspora margarita TaxID=4874 RepID=A0ABN7UT91_GIGMA|nr:24557_t:CDS:10 [Gigaspora margarita]
MAKILKCPGCDREIRTGKTRDLNKHMNLNRNLRKGQCQPALCLMQNPVENPPIQRAQAHSCQNPAENPTPVQNTTLAESQIPIQNQLSKPEVKNNKKIRSKPIPKTDEEWYDIMEIDNKKVSEPSDSEYDTTEEEPDIYFEKIKDPYINRITEAKKLNEGEIYDYYAFVPEGYYAENEPLDFFEYIEEKIANAYKRELSLKGGLKVRIVLYAYMKKIKPETTEPLFHTFCFKHETIEIIRKDRIGSVIEKGYNEIIEQIEDEALQESGWTFIRAKEVFLEISAFRPLRRSSYLSLPKALDKPQLEIINPQNNNDNECFKWSLKANRKPPYLNEIRRLRRNANIANYEGIKFPATLHDIDKFEENNSNYTINIFRPVYNEHMIDLLYLTEGEENLNDRKNKNNIPEGLKTHYVLITDFTRLMRKWNNHHRKKYFCQKCLQFPYSRLDLLQKHILTCPGSSKAPQRLILPEEDLEGKEIEVEKKDNKENTIKEAEQIAVSYGYTIYCSDGTTQKPVINRESENIIKDLIENLQEDLDVILDKLRIPIPCEKMTSELWRKYQMANKCWNCEGKLHEAGYNKIRVFDPETKKYLDASHRKCYEKKPMIQGKLDDEQKEKHKSCKKIAKVTDEKIVPIANNSEQYITFSVGQLQFIDSLKFSLPGLAKMAENLRDEKKGQTKTLEQLAKCFPIIKTKFNKKQLPPRKDFNSDLDGYNYCEHGCENKELQKILSLKEKSNRGCCLEVKLSIPKELHPKFHDYPMCPERKNVPYDWYSSKQKEWAEIETENIYQDMIDDCDLFDFSDYPKDHWVVKNLPEDQWILNDEGERVLKNTKVIGKWKDENGGDQAIGYAGAKGLKKSFIKKELSHKIFEDCVLEGKEDQPRTAQFL